MQQIGAGIDAAGVVHVLRVDVSSQADYVVPPTGVVTLRNGFIAMGVTSFGVQVPILVSDNGSL